MKKRSLWLITGLMTMALLGVFVMQLYYIKESYRLKSQLFEQDVYQSLEAVTNKIQKKNAVQHIDKNNSEFQKEQERNIRVQTDSIVSFKVKFKEAEAKRKFKQKQDMFDYLKAQDSIIKTGYFSPVVISEEDFQSFNNPAKSSNRLELLARDSYDINGKLVGRNVMLNLAKLRTTIDPGAMPDTLRYIALDPVNMLPQLISVPVKDKDLLIKFKIEDARAEHKYQMDLSRLYADTVDLYAQKNLNLVQDVAKELANSNTPLAERIPSQEIIDTLLKRELLSRNISIDYNYWLTPSKNRNQIIYKNIANGNAALPKNTYSKVIFSNDVVIADPGMIYVSFPGQNAAIFGNMAFTLASSAGLLLVLIFIFAYTIFAIIRQKKLSEMKTDFINNMTHEFKTPVATIMIASEALKDPEVTDDRSRVKRLAGIIYDENVRLGNHIERVLNVARIENKELKLDYSSVEVNDLITLVVDSMSLQLQKKNAVLELQLNAVNDTVFADELHLSNVIYNLIDNANKYSLNEPNISITTRNTNKNLIITVSDQGIGMTKEQAKRIFDQFYRVPTGNLHDVKGFGLGLNYVHNILDDMGGEIHVHSEKDKGTSFEIIFPLEQQN